MYGDPKLKTPPANTGPEAVLLRTLAMEFGRQPPNSDPHDRPGHRANTALLKAARAYAKAADGAEVAMKLAQEKLR